VQLSAQSVCEFRQARFFTHGGIRVDTTIADAFTSKP